MIIDRGLNKLNLNALPNGTAVRAVIELAQQNGKDEWLPFSWQEFENIVKNKLTLMVKNDFNNLVKERLIEVSNVGFCVNDAFIAKYWQFVKPL